MQNRMTFARLNPALLSCALALSACADDLAADSAETESSALVATEASGAGESTTTIDSSNAEAWVYFSFASGAEVTPAEPASSPDWDLGFQRFHIISNGGVSGSGGAEVARLVERTFESVTSAPVEGYVVDQADSDDDDAVVDSAFALDGGWYDYDGATNRLSPKPIVYVVRTGSGAHYKLEILDYYDAAGTSGHPSFVWTAL
jgi:hypothetical protein